MIVDVYWLIGDVTKKRPGVRKRATRQRFTVVGVNVSQADLESVARLVNHLRHSSIGAIEQTSILSRIVGVTS